jgi:hypothetical protein
MWKYKFTLLNSTNNAINRNAEDKREWETSEKFSIPYQPIQRRNKRLNYIRKVMAKAALSDFEFSNFLLQFSNTEKFKLWLQLLQLC